MAKDYVAIANAGFLYAGRAAESYEPKSSEYFNKEYNPITAAYTNIKQSRYGSSALEYKCSNC